MVHHSLTSLFHGASMENHRIALHMEILMPFHVYARSVFYHVVFYVVIL